MPKQFRGLLLAGPVTVLLCAGLALPAVSGAAGPANVTMEVTGSSETLRAQVPVTTTAAPVASKDGNGDHTCTGTSAAGALELTTSGSWTGTWYDGFGYGVETVLGETHTFASQRYWAFYLNGLYQEVGVCGAELETGDRIQIYAACAGATSACYAGEPIQLSAPATAAPGIPFNATVRESATTFNSFPTPNVPGTQPSAGATLTGGGTTDGDGKGTITLTQRGSQVVKATKADRPPGAATICVTDGADGFCGTTKPGDPTPTPTTTAPCLTKGDDGLCGTTDTRPPGGSIGSIAEQQRFARGKGPRALSGTATDAQGIRRIRLRLTRTDRRRCTTFDGRRERFVAMRRCGAARGTWFAAGTQGDWSYLLPARLPRGRYVLDVEATDGSANVDKKLERGRNRIVFHVA